MRKMPLDLWKYTSQTKTCFFPWFIDWHPILLPTGSRYHTWDSVLPGQTLPGHQSTWCERWKPEYHDAAPLSGRAFCRSFIYNSRGKQAELSWGSVQAETVRLQRQIDQGLMDIHFKFTKKFRRNFFLCQTNSQSKKFGSKIFWVQKNWLKKNVWTKKQFCRTKD